jgi:hypothetical protein
MFSIFGFLKSTEFKTRILYIPYTVFVGGIERSNTQHLHNYFVLSFPTLTQPCILDNILIRHDKPRKAVYHE